MNPPNSQREAFKRLCDYQAATAVVLGSGLNSLIAEPGAEQIIPYAQFSEIPQPTVPGHAGRFVLSEINKTRIVFAQGRVHLYEGRSAHEVGASVRILAGAGIKQLILTNAAGALNPSFTPGDWMMINDHVNLTGTTPLLGAAKFVDLTDAYSPRLQEIFRHAARKIGMTLHEGVYAGNVGPQYETPAEVRMLQKLGADAVGMSTVLETIQARALDLEVAGFSCITNLAAGISKEKLSHEEVLETGKKAAEQFAQLLNVTL
jgi:purine-nucleoside phosphorylase